MNVISDYLDILQHIEFSIIAVYRAQPSVSDKDIILATERLITLYTREKKGLPALPVSVTGNSLLVFEAMKSAAELRLVRNANEITSDETTGYKVPLRIMIICLQRLLDSMNLWNKKDGFRGYINQIKDFLP